MRGNMLAGIPRATQLRARELAIPSAAAAAVSQMLATTARLGGRAYIPWSPAIGPSVFGNSDGSGGVPGVGGAVGLLDSSGGWGVPSTPNAFPTPTPDFANGVLWGTSGTVVNRTANSFESSGGSGGLTRNLGGVLTPGASYYLRIVGSTTSASGLNYRTSDGSAPLYTVISTAGSFDWTGVVVLGSNSTLFIQNLSAGVTNVSLLEIRQLPTALATALTQATGINKPLVGLGAVPWAWALSFDDNDRLVSGLLAAVATETFITAIRPTSVAALTGFGDRRAASAAGNWFARGEAGGTIRMTSWDGGGAAANAITAGGVLQTGVWQVVTVCRAATRNFIRRNGVEVSTAAVTNVAPAATSALGIGTDGSYSSGGADQLPGIWVPSEVSAADLAVLERGLSAIAGLPI
jgi:hypothetical protein